MKARLIQTKFDTSVKVSYEHLGRGGVKRENFAHPTNFSISYYVILIMLINIKIGIFILVLMLTKLDIYHELSKVHIYLISKCGCSPFIPLELGPVMLMVDLVSLRHSLCLERWFSISFVLASFFSRVSCFFFVPHTFCASCCYWNLVVVLLIQPPYVPWISH